jgi:hypothetical protein
MLVCVRVCGCYSSGNGTAEPGQHPGEYPLHYFGGSGTAEPEIAQLIFKCVCLPTDHTYLTYLTYLTYPLSKLLHRPTLTYLTYLTYPLRKLLYTPGGR